VITIKTCRARVVPDITKTFLTTVAENRVFLISTSTATPAAVCPRNPARNGAPDTIPFCPTKHDNRYDWQDLKVLEKTRVAAYNAGNKVK